MRRTQTSERPGSLVIRKAAETSRLMGESPALRCDAITQLRAFPRQGACLQDVARAGFRSHRPGITQIPCPKHLSSLRF